MAKSPTCPYTQFPPSSNWYKSVARRPLAEIDPVSTVPFKLTPTMRIATAGSCFAQHISRYLERSGYTYFVTEDVMPTLIPKGLAVRYNYRTFPARFGNIYTARQLLQLFDRAYGTFTPLEDHWTDGSNFVDPFRPTIQPGGFETLDALHFDRLQHLRAVRRMFEEAEVFVFTLGLTEAWMSSADGAVFPVCPGCGAGGVFDPEKYLFHNFDYPEILSDMTDFLAKLTAVNPAIRIIVTVSPVPLVATAAETHVLSATIYSKSVLRAVVGKLASDNPSLFYFPSYELITCSAARGETFAEDYRSVKESAVELVMRIFFRHLGDDGASSDEAAAAREAEQERHKSEADRLAEYVGVVCDEELLAN